MKAAELRIGNWVQSSSNKEYQINLSWYECCKDSTEGRDIQLDTFPIPLTEEWLVKFGFKTDGVTFDLQVPFVFHYGYRFSLYNTGNAVDFKRSGWAVRVFQSKQNIEICRIQYVHSLQNLYFAITGEELTIKTKQL